MKKLTYNQTAGISCLVFLAIIAAIIIYAGVTGKIYNASSIGY